MKILQINCVYDTGSTGKITSDLHKYYLEHGFDSYVIYGRGNNVIEQNNVYKTCTEVEAYIHKLSTYISGKLYSGLYFPTKRLIKKIKKINPDIIHLQCINGDFVNIYYLLNWLKKSNKKVVLTLHAEFMYTGNCGNALQCEKWKTGCGNCPRKQEATRSKFFDYTSKSWTRMKNAFENFDNLIVTSVSPWLMNRAMLSPILKNKKHVTVLNGLDEQVFHYYDKLIINEEMKNQKNIFHATPYFTDNKNHIKGGIYILELAKIMPNFNFFVAGPFKEDIVVPKNVILLGKITNQEELANYYSNCDLTLITSKNETFSMVVAESLCCGTPVVGFNAGGPESIGIEPYSTFIEYGNINELKKQIIFSLENTFDKEKIAEIAIKKFSKKAMCESFLKIYGIEGNE